jgi:peptidoglycan/xylan/chitin deacetylase (PgdA/CDA1 family)
MVDAMSKTRMQMVLAWAVMVAGMTLSQAATTRDEAEKPKDPYGIIRRPIPEKLMVLTFDDACLSHAKVVGPLLTKYGCGGTFFVSDAFGFSTRKDWYMTWEQIKGLNDMGFEIGNHTLGHGQLSATGLDGCLGGLMGIEEPCLQNKVAKPTTFCWPFYSVNNKFLAVLTEKGYVFARGGHTRPYQPTVDNPFDAPSFSISDSDLKRDKDVFYKAVKQATPGQVVILTLHGVPDGEHPAVGLDPVIFEEYLKYLKDNQYTVIAMRDLAAYVDAAKAAQLLSRPLCFPWGGRCLPWGWVTSQGNLLYLCVDKFPADRKLTLPGMTTKIAIAYFLADSKKKPLMISKADTGIQTVVVPKFSPAAFGENPTVIVAALQGGPIATILDFVFPGLPAATISGSEIRVKVPLATDLAKLAPTYRTGSPLVKGEPASGSARDFTKPQTYTITAPDGSTRVYVVTVTPTQRAVGVSNHSFETFDVLNEQGPIFAPPAPDGTRHSAFIRGAGNGISQSITFDQGRYTVRFDVVKRNGYSPTASPMTVSIDGTPVLSLQASQITDTWNTYTSPAFSVASGAHTLAFTLDAEGGMDMIDNVVIGGEPKK